MREIQKRECIFTKKMNFPGFRQSSWGWNWQQTIKILLTLPGKRASEFRGKYCVESVANHLMPSHWTFSEKVLQLSKYCNTLTSDPELPPLFEERSVVTKLAILRGGEREVKCGCGFIDLLTPTHVIEVKKLKHWKHALGQVLAYGFLYPKHQREIVLFASQQEIEEKNDEILILKKICEGHGVIVTLMLNPQ